jgi:hypothetical protein
MLTADAARRIGRAVSAYERGNRDIHSPRIRTAGDDGDPVRLCKTSAAWAKGSLATLNVWESGTPPSETQTTGEEIKDAINKIGYVAPGVFVIVAKAGSGSWYLVASEMPPVLKGTFSGAWSKSSTKTVSVSVGSVSFTVTATNSFAAITTTTTKACAVAFDGTTFQLIAAEC